jgi:dihydroflavonol-4-reductase
VRDVARGHVLALERGRVGERYILGGVDLTLAEVFTLIAQAAARPRPILRLHYSAAQALAWLGLANKHEVAPARIPAWFSSAKAERELGYTRAPIGPAIERAIRLESELQSRQGGLPCRSHES